MFTAKKARICWAKAQDRIEKKEKKEILEKIKRLTNEGEKVIILHYRYYNYFNDLNKFVEFLAPLGYRVKSTNSYICGPGVEVYIYEEDWEYENNH